MRGTVAASFRVAALIAEAFPASHAGNTGVNVAITDVTEATPLDLFGWTSDAASSPHYRFTRDLPYGGRVWRVTIVATQSMQAVPRCTTMFWPGILSSLLLAALAWSVASTRTRAVELGRADDPRGRAVAGERQLRHDRALLRRQRQQLVDPARE